MLAEGKSVNVRFYGDVFEGEKRGEGILRDRNRALGDQTMTVTPSLYTQ